MSKFNKMLGALVISTAALMPNCKGPDAPSAEIVCADPNTGELTEGRKVIGDRVFLCTEGSGEINVLEVTGCPISPTTGIETVGVSTVYLQEDSEVQRVTECTGVNGRISNVTVDPYYIPGMN